MPPPPPRREVHPRETAAMNRGLVSRQREFKEFSPVLLLLDQSNTDLVYASVYVRFTRAMPAYTLVNTHRYV